MITIILLLCLASIKDEITYIIDLFATLKGNRIIASSNAFISILATLLEIRFISVFSGSWSMYIIICLTVALIGALTKYLLVQYSKKIKHWIRQKKISNGQKQSWEKRKQKKEDIESLCIGEMK